MLIIPVPTWQNSEPVAPSDTVNNIGGTNTAGLRRRRAVYLVNRTATAVIARITLTDESVVDLPVPAYSALAGSNRWCRVNATGTTNAGHNGAAYEVIHTSGNGAAFTNQPANDGVEVVSSSALDITQSATVYGTTQGTDTVVKETVALNGTTAVSTTKTDWGVILGVVLSAVCAGTVTFREASGNATITTITTGNLSSGVEAVTTSYPTTTPTVVANGATTKQVGLYGTALDGTAQGDSQALNGTTAVAMNNFSWAGETLVLTGDLESNRTVTLSVSSDLVALF
jgi:hypothetical protein